MRNIPTMEPFTLPTDLEVMYLTASVFPDQVPATYTQLEQRITDKTERRYFGYSQPNKEGVIVYRACAEILHASEPAAYQLDTMTIRAGAYASLYISNHDTDGNNIPNAFNQLLKHPQLDPNGFCLELYTHFTDPDVRCLVPIISG